MEDAEVKTTKESDVIEVKHFDSDITAFDDQIVKTEQLYDEVHNLYNELTGGQNSSVGLRSMGAASEMAKTLSSVRSTAIDAVAKRFTAKRQIADMVLKKTQNEQSSENMESFAREMLGAIRSQTPNITVQANGKASSNELTQEEREILDRRIEEEMSKDRIAFSANDRVMKDSFRGVEICYNKKKRHFVAMTKSGDTIDDFPQSRIGDKTITREEDGYAIASGGTRYRMV
jgi:hypothetical protein